MPRLARIARPVLHVGALAAAVSALLTFVIPALTGRFSGEFEDFSIERTAGAALLHGTDPYATFIPIAATTPVHGLGFDYPPVTAWLFQPFAVLPASVADGIWLCFGLACVVGGAVIVARTVLPARWRWSPRCCSRRRRTTCGTGTSTSSCSSPWRSRCGRGCGGASSPAPAGLRWARRSSSRRWCWSSSWCVAAGTAAQR